ncbi:hypothetical protein DFH08DRAFT_1005369 [Mycena albidolilacea]|uniref:BTB domain-containing protein n=1 Tax=Mycena albidolilacea TaxID=1033008 RepID=A0AAD7F5Z3_9AGAR|nr:hypothetical protein DFH08DRAFT_1005369 [Mycena albidolilacea]
MSSPPSECLHTEKASVTRSDIWYEDGNVVLQAESKQFRVHWSILTSQSSFFKDLQGLSQPDENQPCVDGFPVVELPDSVVDVEYLMKGLYLPTFLGQPALPLPVIEALIRLGRKYDFRDLLDFAVARLTYENPTTIEAYDALLDSDRKYTPTRIVKSPGLLFDTITLAQENGIMSVLPCAFYRILRRFETLFDHIPRNDGTLAALSSADLHRCVGPATGSCKLSSDQATPCIKIRDSRLNDYFDSLHLGALSTFSPSAKGNRKLQLCTDYKESVRALVDGGRARMWDELPGFFELPPWDKLKLSDL